MLFRSDDQLVYWFPPGESENIRLALELESHPDPFEHGRLVTVLQAAGYFGPEESANDAT